MRIDISCFPTGQLQTNTIVVSDPETLGCWIFDPAENPDNVVQFVQNSQLTCKAVILTHGHGDHIAGVNEIIEALAPLPLWCPADDAFMLTDANANLSAQFGGDVTTQQADRLLSPGEKLTLDSSEWLILDTPGHTPGGMSFYCSEAETVIVGDALFASGIGRTDLPGGSTETLLNSIHNQLLTLPDNTKVIPGHGPNTTIGIEKKNNPFLVSGY